MAELSPQAQAVFDAVCDNTEPDCDTQHLIAAALRAAADQLAQDLLVIGEPLRGNIAKDAAVVHVADLFTIAAELENQ